MIIIVLLGRRSHEICYGPKSSSKYNRNINTGTPFDGVYNRTPTEITENFLMYEHTDGLNYINTEFSRHDDISSLFKIQNTDKIQINLTEGVGVGLYIQRPMLLF
jgi:hypothetical protein